jgi:hypothetical protein
LENAVADAARRQRVGRDASGFRVDRLSCS